MGVFKTTDGAEWTIAVNVLTVKRVREATGEELLAIFPGGVSAHAMTDYVKCAEMIAAVVQPQLAAAGKTADDFLATLDATALEAAAEALMREIANFSPEPQRTLLLAALDKIAEEMAKAKASETAAARAALESMDMATMSQSTLTNSASSLPASAA